VIKTLSKDYHEKINIKNIIKDLKEYEDYEY